MANLTSDAAHELRTPLAVIKTMAEVEMLDKTLSPSGRSAFEAILEEVDRLSRTINKFL